jgi:hypothetical protein
MFNIDCNHIFGKKDKPISANTIKTIIFFNICRSSPNVNAAFRNSAHKDATLCESHRTPLRGLKQYTKTSGKMQKSKSGGAESGASLNNLAEVVKAWPKLPDSIQAAIVAIVREIGNE